MHATTGGGRVGAAEKGQDRRGPGVSVREAGWQNVYFRGSLGPRSKIQTIEPEIQTCHRGQQSFKSQIDLGSSSGSGFTCRASVCSSVKWGQCLSSRPFVRTQPSARHPVGFPQMQLCVIITLASPSSATFLEVPLPPGSPPLTPHPSWKPGLHCYHSSDSLCPFPSSSEGLLPHPQALCPREGLLGLSWANTPQHRRGCQGLVHELVREHQTENPEKQSMGFVRASDRLGHLRPLRPPL